MPVVLLAAALTVAFGLILVLTREMTFYQDTWAFLMERREFSADAILSPHNEHIAVFPVLIEQLLLHFFGMTSARPEYVLLAAGLVGTAALLFAYVRRRVGDWLALFAVTPVLFLGPAWEVLLWPFEIGFIGSVFFGLAALLALESESRLGDAVACGFLVLAAGFSSLGVPFLVGSTVAVAMRPPGGRNRGACAVAVPVLLFGAWYGSWGYEAESHVSLENVWQAPIYVAEAISANVGSALGLNPDPTSGALGRGPNVEPGLDPIWNRAVVLVLVGALLVRRVRGASLPRTFWPVAVLAMTNWLLTALNYFPGREPTNSRYQYAGAIFVVMLVANLFDGVRVRQRTVAVLAALAVLVTVPHLVVLVRGAEFLEEQSVLTRADSAAIEIAAARVDPEFQLTAEVAGTPTLPNVFAGKYFTAVAKYGSPAYTPAELATAPPDGRFQADVVLTHALPLALTGGEGRVGDGIGCRVLPPGAGAEVELAPGTTARIEVAPGPDATFLLRRFAGRSEYPVRSEGQPGGSVSLLTIPADAVAAPWHFAVEAGQRVRVCGGRR
ncbi:MAG TPA: hypothetical protein VFU16_10920 [Solirubrobacterales bacterium]|nr:hypothetical protein [Solirubrobacterales bacterium]